MKRRCVVLFAMMVLGACVSPQQTPTPEPDVDAGVEPPECPDSCGEATACAAPFCDVDLGVCDPGYLTEDPADPTLGDCHREMCTGNHEDALTVIDDGDVPADTSCSDLSCSNGDIVGAGFAEGSACVGEAGVCDGAGACRACRDTASGASIDAGCNASAQHCNESANDGDGACVTIVTTTWDPAWSPPGVSYTNNNRSISGNSAGYKNVRTSVGKSTGRYYWEITATGGDGATNAGGLGILESAMPSDTYYIGYVASGLSFGYGTCCQGQYWMSWSGATINGAPPSGSAVTAGTVYMFALDLDTHRFWAGQNGVWYNGGNPSTGVAPAAQGFSGTVYPGVTFYPSSINAFTANFGDAAFIYPTPSGFTPGFY